MTINRAGRVADIVRDTLSEILRRDLRDPRVGFVTFTEVRLSPDLRHATVFVSTIVDESERKAAIDALNHAAPYLKRTLAKRARLRFTPQLRFVEDRAAQRGTRVEELLLELDLDGSACEDGDDDPEGPVGENE